MGPFWPGQYIGAHGIADNTTWLWIQGVPDGHTAYDASALYEYIITSQNPIYDQWSSEEDPAEVRGWIEFGKDPDFHAWLGGEPLPVQAIGGSVNPDAGSFEDNEGPYDSPPGGAPGSSTLTDGPGSSTLEDGPGSSAAGDSPAATPPAPEAPPDLDNVPSFVSPEDIPPALQIIYDSYKENGLTYKSNIPGLINRDGAGNIILNEDATNNQWIVIEPVHENFTNKSIIDTIDTQFKFFKFPARTNVTFESSLPEDFSNIEIEIDNISGYYVPPYRENPETGAPSTYRRLNTSYDSSWFSNGGADTKGLTRIPFEKAINGPGQIEPGAFTFTPDIIKELNDRNNTVRFIAHITCRAQSTTSNVGFNFTINRNMPSWYRSNCKLGNAGYPIYNAGNRYGGGLDHVESLKPLYGHQPQGYPSMTLDYIVDIGEVAEYDAWEFRAEAGGGAWYLSDLCFWEVRVIPDPGHGTGSRSNYGLQTTSTIGDYYINDNQGHWLVSPSECH